MLATSAWPKAETNQAKDFPGYLLSGWPLRRVKAPLESHVATSPNFQTFINTQHQNLRHENERYVSHSRQLYLKTDYSSYTSSFSSRHTPQSIPLPSACAHWSFLLVALSFSSWSCTKFHALNMCNLECFPLLHTLHYIHSSMILTSAPLSTSHAV